MHFYEMSLGFQFFFLLNCCTLSTILLTYAKEGNSSKHLYHKLLMKSKLLLSFFTAPGSSPINWSDWLNFFVMFSTCISGVLLSDNSFKVTSESAPTLFIPFSSFFKTDCKLLICQGFLHTFSIFSTGTKILLFFLRQIPAK